MTASKKHIAIIIDSLAGGGAEKVMLTLANEMLAQGHSVSMFVLKTTTQYTVNPNINVVFPCSDYKKSLRGWFNTKKLATYLTNSLSQAAKQFGKFDLSLVNLHESYRLGSAIDLPNPYYVIHNSYVQELKREKLLGPVKYFYMRHILKKLTAKRLIAVSEGVKDELKKSRLFTPKSVLRIYNPFDIADITELATQALEDDVQTPFVLHVGRAAKAKRHDILFEAFKSVDENYKLVCLSSNTKKLARLAVKYGIQERVVLPGFTENPYKWMQKASALALSSDFEGLPTVLIESLACNTTVVSTNCPHGPSEIMMAGLTKFLVDVGDVDALANAINASLNYKLTEHDKAFLNEISVSKITALYLELCE